MKARFLRQQALDELRKSVKENLAAYRSGDFTYLEHDLLFSFEHHLDINTEKLASLRAPNGTQLFEAENCQVLFASLKALTPYEARDERLWAYLSHTILLPHARVRWPIPPDDAEAARHISKHFFAREKRQVERDNVGSRLWWMAHLCARVGSADQMEALQAFLFRSDVRANLVERPTTSQTVPLFSAILNNLMASYKGKQVLFQRNVFRFFMREINSVGGYKLLDCLPQSSIQCIVDDIVHVTLQIESL